MQIEQEKMLSPGEVVFLDRAIPDALAYSRFLHLSEDEKLLKALNNISITKYLSWAFFCC
jgi:predicted ATPase